MIFKSELAALKGNLKKFIKLLANGPKQAQSIPYHKLLKIASTLCQPQNRAQSQTRDMTSLFIKSMFNDGLL